MKIRFIIFLLLSCGFAHGQEYWNPKDFEIGNRGIENTWRDYGFTWQTDSNFDLPNGNFLDLKDDFQKQQVDMLAVITKTNRNKIQRKVDLGSPLPEREREKKTIQFRTEAVQRDQNDIFNDPLRNNPFYRNTNYYNYRGFGVRRYSPYQYNY